ncbi:uncharacterized protein LOC128387996 [Panonychus citri]|uniref:uncharacterized protein LOC128387996 n=1 Tax=Panonychus citri TaxID=50023 RepID=UPI00230753E1|nr:uncharacterized protein LOC128387996 [Panonychus citri]
MCSRVFEVLVLCKYLVSIFSGQLVMILYVTSHASLVWLLASLARLILPSWCSMWCNASFASSFELVIIIISSANAQIVSQIIIYLGAILVFDLQPIYLLVLIDNLVLLPLEDFYHRIF